MSDKFVMSSRQAAELDYAFERNGWTPADVKLLSGGNILANILPIVKAYGEVAPMAYNIINCDAIPFVPSGLRMCEKDQLPGRIRGQFVFDNKVKLYLSRNQQDGKLIKGFELMKELANEPVLPANVLDYWLKNPHLIPDELKKDKRGKTLFTFFWGKIYRGSHDDLCVRCLYFSDGGWRSDYGWLEDGWGSDGPAALRAS